MEKEQHKMFYRQKYTTYKMYVINEQGEQVGFRKGDKDVSKELLLRPRNFERVIVNILSSGIRHILSAFSVSLSPSL